MKTAVSALSRRQSADLETQILILLRDEAAALPKPTLAFLTPPDGIRDEPGPGEIVRIEVLSVRADTYHRHSHCQIGCYNRVRPRIIC